jgi:DNA-binding LacI/PurR family transcriptional regulator
MTATLRDVALLAGVSVSTASRSISGDHTGLVATETQERVWDAVRRLKYEPNDAAQRLVRVTDNPDRRTHNVGLILGNTVYKFDDPFWSPVLNGVETELNLQQYHLRFAFTFDDLKLSHQRRLLSRAHIDGLILAGDVAPFGDELGRERVVAIEGGNDSLRWEQPLPIDVIAMEKRRAMYRLVDHLVALGHRRLVFLGPPADREERAEAFFHALIRHKLFAGPTCCVESPWSTEETYPVARALLAERVSEIDVLVCACDTIAVGAIRAAKDLGLRLPGDLAITGFDDVSYAGDLDPSLTTVHVPKELMGMWAARRLIERINHPDQPATIQVVPTTLIVRASCGAVPGTVQPVQAEDAAPDEATDVMEPHL